MGRGSVVVGVFQETKLTEGIYTQLSEGYRVVAMPAPSRYKGGVAIFYRDSPVFSVEAIRQFGANVILCQLATGERRWYIVGSYLVTGDRTTTRDVEAAMAEKPRGEELIVAGDLNAELGKEGGRGRDEEIMSAVAMTG